MDKQGAVPASWMQGSRLAWLALGLCAALGILAASNAWSWVGKRFPGYLITTDWFVSAVALGETWSGADSGVRVGDRIVALDSRPLAETPGQYIARVRTEPITLRHRVEVQRGAERMVVLVPSPELSLEDFAYAFGSLLAAGLAGLGIATFLLARKDLAPDALAGAWAGLALGFWAFVEVLESLAASSPGLAVAAAAGVAGAAIGLIQRWQPDGSRIAGGLAWILAPFTLLGLLVDVLAAYGFAWAAAWVPFGRLIVGGVLAAALVGLAAVATWQAATSGKPAERRAGAWVAVLLYFGLAVAAGAALLRARSGTTPLPLGWVALAFVPGLLAQAYVAIERETAGLERIGSRMARGLVLAALALLAYSIAHALLALALAGKVPLGADLVLTAGCVIAAVPGYTRLKKTVDPLFMRTGYDPVRVVTEFARAAREAYDPDLIVSAFYDDLSGALKCTAGVVYLSSQGTLTPVVAEGCTPQPAAINGGGPDLAWLLPGQPVDPGRYPGAAEGLALPFSPRLAMVLAAEDPDEDGPIGLVVLGPREGDRPYGAADRDLVMELGRIMARGVQTTRLLSRRAAEDRQRRELEVAWEVQANLLPRELPALEGADLEAYARSAREVGGDFYDVLQVDANRWGILVGEATGRGIASALLAEVTLSFFRSAAPGTPSPAECLRIVNNLICLYRPSLRASVTVSYAVYDRRDKSLAVSNAGQAHPLLNGYPVAIDGVPLAVGRDAGFAENRLTLKKGDAVLWYTDGVPGAESDAGKAFGMERLLLYARDERLRDAEEPWRLRELLRDHVGDTEQPDDMTYLLLMVR